MEKIYISKSAYDTTRLGGEFAKKLQGGDVIALYGDLGSGKTTFVQGLARGLGVKQRIISPTFVIIRQYKASPPRCNAFYHIDLYRIDSERAIKGLGLEEIISDPQNIVAIEWAEKMGNMLPKKRIDIYFEYVDEHKRRITRFARRRRGSPRATARRAIKKSN